jgi:hypothetical protein
VTTTTEEVMEDEAGRREKEKGRREREGEEGDDKA